MPMTEILEHSRRYWQYEYDVSVRYMVPLLEKWNIALRGSSVLDVGCGEGGGVCGLNDQGARCTGYDISAQRIAVADELKDDRTIPFSASNLYDDPMPHAGTTFDLVVLHDVFEHLEEKERTLTLLARYLNPRGRMLITFPPFYSAFGAHQQLLRSRFVRLPFFHLLPFAMSQILPRMNREDPNFLEEVRKLGRMKMGIRKFERVIQTSGFSIVGRQAYLIGPNHIRFGLTPVPAGLIARVPLIREFVCSGVVYLLSRNDGPHERA
jgi:SAM-dependent methyltransferase